MWLVDVSIRRPVFATMMISSLVVMGFVAFRGLGVDLFPKIEFPYVSVQTTQPGAAPSSIETEVTDKIEEAVNSISGIRQLRSVSADGLSQVNIEFELNEDPDVKAQEVRDKISGIVADLPDDADAPIVERLDPDAAPVVLVMIAGEQPVAELTRFADEVVKERLQRISGVGSVTLVGGRDREMRIWLDPSKLKAVGLSAPDVLRSVRNENAQLPGGRLETEARQREFGVRTLAEARTAEEFKQMMLAHREGGRSTRLDDIARVEDSVTDERSYAQLNGVVGVALEVRRQSGRNTIEVAKAVMAEVAELQQNAPQGMRLVVARDISRFIESSIDDVLFDLVLAVILVIGITFFFLLSWRATVIVGLAIPTSIMATFFIFGVADFTVNIMTMLALTVAVGLLVDDAIVVVEAVERDIEAGLSPPEAAASATRRVALAVLAGTFATLAVFVPISVMEGIVGQFLIQYGLTIVFSVSVSLLVALTLTPMLASRFMRLEHRDHGWLGRIENFHRRMAERYAELVAWTFSHTKLVILAAAGSLVIGGIFASMVPSTFLGEADRSEYLATVKLPLGTGIATARDAALRADAALRRDDQIKLVFITAGAGIRGRTNLLEFYVETTPKRGRSVSQGELMNRARTTLTKTFPEAVEISINEVPWVSGGGVAMNPIELVVSGSDINRIAQYAATLEEQFRADPLFTDIRSTYEGGRPEVQVRLDRARATDLGVAAREVASATQIMLGGVEAGTFEVGGRRYDVRVRMEEDLRQSLFDLGQLPVRSASGALADMASVADIGVESGPTQIDRLNRARQVTIILNLPPGTALGDADARAEEIVADFPPPAGMTIQKEGMARRLGDTSSAIIAAFVLALIALYIVLASQFDRFAQPLLIMLTAPLSFSGAFFAMWAAGQQMSLFAQIGLLALMGIVMKNGILLIDRANQLREEGRGAHEAMLQAAPERLRPVLMTAMAAVFGMIPVALSQSDGAEWRNPMGFIIIGGLTTSTLLTLVVIPAIYVAVAGVGSKLAGIFGNRGRLIDVVPEQTPDSTSPHKPRLP